MTASRMEAFSDGVLAILITIMVLELRVPAGSSASSLRTVLPGLLCYVLSFVNLGIYWNNHHHLLKTVERVNGWVLWANLVLLFWLSLLPFATEWMSKNSFATLPVAVYGCVLLVAGISYYLLGRAIIGAVDHDSMLAEAVGRDAKGVASVCIYAAAIATCLVSRWVALGGYVVVAIMWLVPDRRLAPTIEEHTAPAD
ncbi:MAG TPA: TMEM175 family protein [Acidimicrobiales bacterium]|nr:TMEM175 family protein [Acidimicrobiales bacterium]